MKDWKKSVLLILTAIMVVLLYAFGSGTTEPYKINGTIIGVQSQHDTRVYVLYKDKNEKIVKRSTHQSEIITDGVTTINPHDYLPGYGRKTSYGAIPGYESDYAYYETGEYLKRQEGKNVWRDYLSREHH